MEIKNSIILNPDQWKQIIFFHEEISIPYRIEIREETILSAVLTPLPHPEPIPARATFFFFSKHNFPRLRYILKIHSVWGIFLSAAKNKKKRKKREKKKEKKSLRAVERPSNRKLTSSSLSCFSRRIVATRITFISKDLYRGEHGFRTSSKNFINVFRIVC